LPAIEFASPVPMLLISPYVYPSTPTGTVGRPSVNPIV
jgi:hypothetical protein